MRVAYKKEGSTELVYRDMTSEEVAEWEKLQQEILQQSGNQPTTEELADRIAALEQNAIGG